MADASSVGDKISILRHSTIALAKTWRADGSIEPYADAKYFSLQERELSDIRELSALLSVLERQPRACVIRGQYVGDERAAAIDPEHKPGKVRRTLDLFEDVPRHWCLIEVDNFEPLVADMSEPLAAIDEFLSTHLPAFAGSSFHWQLSNSAGHAKNVGKLKVHLWFWLEEARTSEQMRAWCPAAVDKAVFNPVQVHYTAAPIFEEGVHDPFDVRSGFVEGLLGDVVALGAAEPAPAPRARLARSQRLERAAASDPLGRLLLERGLVKGVGKRGELLIDCPRARFHTGESGETSTVYYPAHTGGYEKGSFKCLHAHCVDVPQALFHAELGYDEVLDDFENLDKAEGDVAGGNGASTPQTPATRRMPPAQHLTTDQANAGRLIKRFGRRMISIGGRWHAWTGKHWKQDEGEARRYALHLSKLIHEEAKAWDSKPVADQDEAQRNMKIAEGLRKWAAKSENKHVIDAALALARELLKVQDELVDCNPWLLNCANGTVDVRTGHIREHNPEDYITRLVPLDYDPAARAPLWEETIAKITLEEGRATQPVAAFLRRWFGYCASGSTREQVFVVHWGTGRNGKSTTLDTIAEVLGDYAGVAPPGMLIESRGERHPTEIMTLQGKRMVTAHESSESGLLREGFIKHATGGDKLSGRFMHGNFFTFAPTHKLQLLTNHKPTIRGQDDGIWRRVLLMPYHARFGSPEEVADGTATHLRDPKILETLAGERAGILTWIVAGAIEWARDGLRAPDAVRAASKDYQTEQDRVLQYLHERCELGAELKCHLGDAYNDYRTWCAENGMRALSKRKFQEELARVVPHYHSTPGRVGGREGRRDVVIITGLRILADVEGM